TPGTESLRDRVLSEILATPQYVLLGAMEGMFGAGQPDWALKNVRVPLLVINAKNAMWTPDYEAYVRSLSPQTDYRVLDGAGRWPQRNGVSQETGLLKEWPKDGPRLHWKVTEIGSGYSTPAVVADRLYLLGNQGLDKEFVQALAVRDGKRVWSTRLGNVGNPK